MSKMKIAFIPIDNRPVCYTLVEQIAKIDKNLELLLPDRKYLGDLKKNADVEPIYNWLSDIVDIDAIILSLDTIAHGGLIPSRRSTDSFVEVESRMLKFKELLKEKNTKIYAFSSIMRISNNNVNEEEKEYWSEYGEKIFKYSYDLHKDGEVKTDVPAEIIEDYTNTRKRNFDINKMYLEWQKEELFNTLVFSKDDCAEFGLNVQEAKALDYLIRRDGLDKKTCAMPADAGMTTISCPPSALIKTGADEIPLSLLARAIIGDKKVKIAPKFTHPDFINNISKYEDISVYESVKGQIELAGAKFSILSDEKDADITLLVNNFKETQGELVMGVDVEGFDGQFILPEKPYVIADILNANGADNSFVEKLLALDIDSNKFLGYAGWNTTGNTLGSTLCCALVKYFAQDYDENAFKKVQMVRFLDDWAYQANVRKFIKSKDKSPNTENLKTAMCAYEEILNKKFGTNFSPSYGFPWDRFFEVEVKI